MDGFGSFPISIVLWLLSASIASSLVALLIVAVKKTLGYRLSPGWHYSLWFVPFAKLLLPWTATGAFYVEAWIPPRATGDILPIYEWTPRLANAVSPAESDSSFAWLAIFCFWAAVASYILLRSFLANRKFAGRLRKLELAGDPAVLRLLEECKQRLSIRRDVRLVSMHMLSGPALFGYFRPYLIVPHLRDLASDENRLRCIFLHELAHLKRHDIAAIWLVRLLLAIHWFNPILWYASRKMREDQEVACDALALSRLGEDETKAYGHTLLELFENASNKLGIAGLASLSGNMPQIKRRLILIRRFRKPDFRSALTGVLISSLLASSVFSYGITKAEASLTLSAVDSSLAEARLMPISPYDGQGIESRYYLLQDTRNYLLLTKRSGQWEVEFMTPDGEPDPKATAESQGTIVLPETGYYSKPGTRDFVFKKGPNEKKWKLVGINEH